MDVSRWKKSDGLRAGTEEVRLKNRYSNPYDGKKGFGYCGFCGRRMPNMLLYGGQFGKRCSNCFGKVR